MDLSPLPEESQHTRPHQADGPNISVTEAHPTRPHQADGSQQELSGGVVHMGHDTHEVDALFELLGVHQLLIPAGRTGRTQPTL